MNFAMNDLILYTTEDGKSQIKLRTTDQTVWLTQREMAELFDVSTDNVGLHLTNLYEDGELSREATTEEASLVQTEGAFFGRDNFSACIHGLDAFLGRYECSLPEIFGRVAKHANRVVPT